MWNFTDDKESSFSPLPAGVYNVRVDSAEETQTKNFDKRLKMVFIVTDGEFQGRKIFTGFNLTGNEQAVQIARGQLKSLLKVGGKSLDIQGPHEFVGIEVAAAIKVKEAKDGYEASNNISSFKPKVAVKESEVVPF